VGGALPRVRRAAPGATFWLILLGIALHGICYDFFFVTGQIYVDKKSTAEIRGQAQGFFVFITYGVGMFVGAWIAGKVYNSFLGGAPALTLERWRTFWYFPAAFAFAVLAFFVLFFREERGAASAPAPLGAAPAGGPNAVPAGAAAGAVAAERHP
jgi:MFS family permease